MGCDALSLQGGVSLIIAILIYINSKGGVTTVYRERIHTLKEPPLTLGNHPSPQ